LQICCDQYTPESIQLKELLKLGKIMDISFWVIFQIRKENQEIKGNLQDLKTFQ
jgi:hypothetical protein